MATKDLYGIGKGSAQVVDLRPVNAMVQNRAEENRQRNAAKEKRRSTNAAAINSQMDKLKNTAWSRDQQYVSDLTSDTRSWMVDTYSKHGEMALVDNPQLKREFDEKVSFIKRQNDASHANITMGNKMLEQRSHNLDDIDYESAKEFDKWLDLPPAERLSTPMPIIKDRELTLRELFIEEGMDKEILSSYIPTERTGSKNPETGEYYKYEGKTTNEDKYNTTINGLNTNTKGKIFGKANRLAIGEIESDALPPFIEVDGEEVPNPEYQDKLNVTRKRIIEEIAERFKGTTYENKTRGFGSVKEEKEEKPSGFRTSTGLRSGYFKTKLGEGFTLSDQKKSLIPIEVTVVIDGREQVVKVLPSEFVKNSKGKWFVKGAAYRDTWEELTEKEQKEYDTEDKYEMFISKSQDLNIPVTPNVEAKIESQYGVSDLDTFLKDSKNQGKESQKEEPINTTAKGGTVR